MAEHNFSSESKAWLSLRLWVPAVVSIGVALLLFGLTLIPATDRLLANFEHTLSDARFVVAVESLAERTVRPQDRPVVFIDIDDETVQNLGTFPVPREVYIKLFEVTKESAAVGFDIFFLEPKTYSEKLTYEEYLEKLSKRTTAGEDEARAAFELLSEKDVDLQVTDKARENGNVVFAVFFGAPYDSIEEYITENDGLTSFFRTYLSEHPDVHKAIFDPLTNEVGSKNLLGEIASTLEIDWERAAAGLDLYRKTQEQIILETLSANLYEGDQGRMRSDYNVGPSDLTPEQKFDRRRALFAKYLETLKQTFPFEPKPNEFELRGALNSDRARGIADILANSSEARSENWYKALDAWKNENSPDPELFRKVDGGALRPMRLFTYGAEITSGATGDYSICPINQVPLLHYVEQPAGPGFVVVYPDADGVMRRYPLMVRLRDEEGQMRLFPSLAMALILRRQGVTMNDVAIGRGGEITIPGAAGMPELKIPADPNGDVTINWAGRWNEDNFLHLSFGHILAANEEQKRNYIETLKDKIVVVGLTATGTHDLNPMPLQSRYPMVGSHANTVATILENNYIHRMSDTLKWAIVLLISLGISYARAFFKILPSLLVLIASLFVYTIVLNVYLFAYARIEAPQATPINGAILAFMVTFSVRYFVVERHGRNLAKAFSSYLDAKIVKKIMDHPDMLALGGDKKNLTMFFTDLKGFTSISEQLLAEELVKLMNQYLGIMTRTVEDYEGHVDKFIGDAIMAVFGAFDDGEEDEPHQVRACRAAIQCQKNIVTLNVSLEKQGLPKIGMRVGLHSGDVVIGNMGSDTRKNYTVMGDSVNLAARLEPINNQYGTWTCVSEATRNFLGDDFVVRKLDKIAVKGKTEPVVIYELVGLRDEVPEERIQYNRAFEAALEMYFFGDFAQSKIEFEALLDAHPEDKAVKEFLTRTSEYLHNPPGKWDGVHVMTTK
ncbi:MAG: CHASE2 domain-containing protein [Planctomycetes bacterium]|nr:CHASE2 domain-containing protein [Planctomycetota bacterium]